MSENTRNLSTSHAGKLYVIFFFLDGFFSLIALIYAPVMGYSQMVTSFMLVFTLFICVLIMLERLFPVRVFQVMMFFYLAIFLFSEWITSSLLSRVSSETVQAWTGLEFHEFLTETYTWYIPLAWIVSLAQIIFGAWAILRCGVFDAQGTHSEANKSESP